MSTLPLFDRDGDGNGNGNGRAERRERVYRVSALNRAVRSILEDRWRNVWVEGELSDVSRAASGHVYATLNDEKDAAQLRVVMFRSDAARAKATLADGERVRFRGTLSLFEPRGSYQLIARVALPAGQGDLAAEFERLRRKLKAEGLFDAERKRPLPRLPRLVGVVTSPSGAALHDIVRVASSRTPTHIVVSPCLVQGAEAPASIVAALDAIQQLPELDVVIVGRGGGAAEDLFAFNDERVARAIAACRVPTLSAVGHELDVTIADLVADCRAATPSNAAELAVADRQSLRAELQGLERELQRAMLGLLERDRVGVERARQRLSDPRRALSGTRAQLDRARARLAQQGQRRVRREALALAPLRDRLSYSNPRLRLGRDRMALGELRSRLRAFGEPAIASRRSRLQELSARLDAMSPLGVLARGYAIALHEPSGKALLDARDARVGDRVRLHLHRGALGVHVDEIEAESDGEEPS